MVKGEGFEDRGFYLMRRTCAELSMAGAEQTPFQREYSIGHGMSGLLRLGAGGSLPLQLIEAYFGQLQLHSLLLVVCPPRGDEAHLLSELSGKGFSVSFLADSISDLPTHRSGAVLDLSCLSLKPIIDKFTKKRAFGVHTEWLFLDQVNSTKEFQVTEGLGKLSDAYMLPSSLATLLQTDGERLVYYELFRVSVHRPLETHFRSSQLVDEPFQRLPPLSRARLNFKGVTLTAAAVLYHMEQFTGFDSYEHPEVDTIPKLNYPIVQTLSEQLNFSLTLLLIDDYGWQTNMTFSGLMGMLQREEIDLGATGIFMRPDRIVTVDFTGDTFQIKNKLIFKQPSLSSVSNIFVQPFTVMVWICCLALSVLTSGLLIFDSLVKIGRREAFSEPVTSSDIVTTIIGCVCQQGATIVPKSGSAKITLFLFSLCTLFFYTSYSANIVALLQSTSPTIRTLTDLTNSPLSVGVQDVIYNRIYFEEAVDKDIKNLYHKKVLPQGNKAFMMPDEGIQRVRSGLFAYTVETHWGYKIISDTFLESEKCGIDEMRLFLLPKLSIPVIKKSGYRELFTVKNTLQRDVGLHSRVKRRWLLGKPQCDSRGRGYVGVGLTDFKPALQVMGYGFAAAFLVFAAELILFYRHKLLTGERDNDQHEWNELGYNFQKKFKNKKFLIQR